MTTTYGSLISRPSGMLWFLLPHDSLPGQDAIGTITVDGKRSRMPLPTDNGRPTGFTPSADGSELWIANSFGSLVRVTADP